MADRFITIGGNVDILAYDDAEFDYAVSTDGKINSSVVPDSAGDMVRFEDLTGGLDNVVYGPGASTDEAIPRWNGTGGTSLQDSGITINDDNQLTERSLTKRTAFSKALTDGVATGLFEVAITAGQIVGGNVSYTIKVSDGTDLQGHTGIITFVAANKSGTISTDIDEVYLAASTTDVATSGTLSDTWTVTTGTNKITINLNANTSLTPTSMTVVGTIELQATNVITLL